MGLRERRRGGRRRVREEEERERESSPLRALWLQAACARLLLVSYSPIRQQMSASLLALPQKRRGGGALRQAPPSQTKEKKKHIGLNQSSDQMDTEATQWCASQPLFNVCLNFEQLPFKACIKPKCCFVFVFFTQTNRRTVH